jgi:hypothetical protein
MVDWQDHHQPLGKRVGKFSAITDLVSFAKAYKILPEAHSWNEIWVLNTSEKGFSRKCESRTWFHGSLVCERSENARKSLRPQTTRPFLAFAGSGVRPFPWSIGEEITFSEDNRRFSNCVNYD